ncbi:MAG: hypothetical protein FWE84_05805 [Firmicutes bacterium]|nr:hypothetical protein [Bacillota bacterium]
MKTKQSRQILCFFLAAVFCLALTGCAGTDNSQPFDEKFPWSDGEHKCVETATYSFSRYLTGMTVDENFVLSGEDKTKGYKLNSFGELAYTVMEGFSVEPHGDGYKEVSKNDLTLIKMSLTVEYKIKEELNHIANTAVVNQCAGKKDTMESFAVVNSYSLAPVFTYKNAVIEAGNNKSYTLTADYTGEITGTIGAKLVDSLGSTLNTEIKGGSYYDSESIYFIIRAMRSVNTNGSRAFNIVSPLDDLYAKAKRTSPKGAQQSTATGLSSIVVGEDLYKLFDGNSDTFALDCYKTELKLTEEKSGPPIDLYYSAIPTVSSYISNSRYAAEKVLVEMSYKHGVFLQEFTLVEYENTY